MDEEERRLQIERAQKMLFEGQDRVKALHGKMLLSDVMAEREMQMQYKSIMTTMRKEQNDIFVQKQREAIELAEEAELAKLARERQKMEEQRQTQHARLEEVKNRIRADQQRNREEGLMLREMAQEDARKAAEEEATRRAMQRRAVEEAVLGNQALKVFKERERQKDLERDRKVEEFNKDYDRRQAEYRQQAEEKRLERMRRAEAAGAKMAKLLDAQTTKVESNDESIRLHRIKDDAIWEERERITQEARALMHQQVELDRERQMQERADRIGREKEEVLAYVEELKVQAAEAQARDEAKEAARKARNLHNMKFVQRQAEMKTKKKAAEKAAIKEEELTMKIMMQQDDQAFQDYAQACLEELSLTGRSVLPVQTLLNKPKTVEQWGTTKKRI